MSFCPPVCQHIYWPFCHYVEVSGSMSVSISVNLSVCLCVIHQSSCMYLCVHHSVIFRCSCVSFSVSVHPSVNITFLLNFQCVCLFFSNSQNFCVSLYLQLFYFIFVRLSISVSANLSEYHSIYLSFNMSVWLFI